MTDRRRLTTVLAAVILLGSLAGCGSEETEPPVTLKIYAGAGLRKGVDALIAAFGERTGIVVEPDYAGSNTILGSVKMKRDGDLFMPGDVWYVEELHRQTKIVAEKRPVAWFVPVIIVRKGETRVKSLADLLDKDLRVGLGDPKACQVGRLSVKLFKNNGLDVSRIPAGNLKQSLTVNLLGTWVVMKDVDAAIVWDVTAANLGEKVDVVEIPRDKNIISQIVIGLLSDSKHPAEAREFIEFATGPEGRAILKANGFRVDAP